MPAGHTKLPTGRPPLDPESLRAVWLEEGDGVAILEHDEPLAVIPGWSDMSTGMPGYSRDMIGQTPFGWSLDDAMEGLGPRLSEAERFWRWRTDPRHWARFRQAHASATCWPARSGRQVLGRQRRQAAAGRGVRAAVRPPQRPYTVLSTVGMSCQRMPVIEQAGDGAGPPRIELALATTMPSTEAARIFLWLAQYPWREVTWLGAGHSIPWYHEPATFPLGGGNAAILLLDNPGQLHRA